MVVLGTKKDFIPSKLNGGHESSISVLLQLGRDISQGQLPLSLLIKQFVDFDEVLLVARLQLGRPFSQGLPGLTMKSLHHLDVIHGLITIHYCLVNE